MKTNQTNHQTGSDDDNSENRELPMQITLSPEEYAAIDAATPYSEGKGISIEEAVRKAEDRTKAWMEAPSTNDRSA